MEFDKEERIKILKHKNKIQNILPDFIDSFNELSREKIKDTDLINIDEMPGIISKIRDFHSKNPSNLCICYPYEYQDKFLKIISVLNENLKNKNLYFTTSRFYNDLIFKIKTKSVINDHDKILKVYSDGFYIYDSKFSNGIKFQTDEEHWFDKTKNIWTNEIKIWGHQWIDIIYKEYKSLIFK
ncbi:MAG: hypothetical protein JXB00_01645 [Bacteroidales bacterium]|nr:hypothetical protein [Bacteroidales bacterium]